MAKTPETNARTVVRVVATKTVGAHDDETDILVLKGTGGEIGPMGVTDHGMVNVVWDVVVLNLDEAGRFLSRGWDWQLFPAEHLAFDALSRPAEPPDPDAFRCEDCLVIAHRNDFLVGSPHGAKKFLRCPACRGSRIRPLAEVVAEQGGDDG